MTWQWKSFNFDHVVLSRLKQTQVTHFFFSPNFLQWGRYYWIVANLVASGRPQISAGLGDQHDSALENDKSLSSLLDFHINNTLKSCTTWRLSKQQLCSSCISGPEHTATAKVFWTLCAFAIDCPEKLEWILTHGKWRCWSVPPWRREQTWGWGRWGGHGGDGRDGRGQTWTWAKIGEMLEPPAAGDTHTRPHAYAHTHTQITDRLWPWLRTHMLGKHCKTN